MIVMVGSGALQRYANYWEVEAERRCVEVLERVGVFFGFILCAGLGFGLYLESEVAQNNRPLYPKDAHNPLEVAHSPAPLQLPFERPQIPSNRDYNVLNRGTLGAAGLQATGFPVVGFQRNPPPGSSSRFGTYAWRCPLLLGLQIPNLETFVVSYICLCL